MKKIFITATNTDIGKTYTTLKLLQLYAKKGYKVGAIKPIETGVKDTPVDGMKLLTLQKILNPDLEFLDIDDVVLVKYSQPAAPYIANNQKETNLDMIDRAIKKFKKYCDMLFIEGAGGLYVPINKDYFMIDFIESLHVDKVVLVTHCNLGCINDTLLSQKALVSKGLSPKIIFNCRDFESTKNFEKTSKPFFEDIGIDIITTTNLEKIYL